MTGKVWMKFKKGLPGNWAQVVADNITASGTTITAKQVSQIRSGDIISFNLQELVWTEIKKLKEAEARNIAKINALKQIVN